VVQKLAARRAEVHRRWGAGPLLLAHVPVWRIARDLGAVNGGIAAGRGMVFAVAVAARDEFAFAGPGAGLARELLPGAAVSAHAGAADAVGEMAMGPRVLSFGDVKAGASAGAKFEFRARLQFFAAPLPREFQGYGPYHRALHEVPT
jgi:hypothetical protein